MCLRRIREVETRAEEWETPEAETWEAEQAAWGETWEEEQEMPEAATRPNPSVRNSILRLNEDMRLAWLNHVYWTRMYLMSAVADNADQQAVEERLLETADEITDVFARYLPIATTRQLRNLLTEHIEIGGQIIQALKAKNMSDYDALVQEWYRNANQMATLFANYNPYFEGRETRNMFLNHLDLTREEIEHQVNGEYEQSIDVFRDVEQQALAMADYFARGLLAR